MADLSPFLGLRHVKYQYDDASRSKKLEMTFYTYFSQFWSFSFLVIGQN